MASLKEALENRKLKYEGWSDTKLLMDAYYDVLKTLNVFTDITIPDNEDIEHIQALACALAKIAKTYHYTKDKHIEEIDTYTEEHTYEHKTVSVDIDNAWVSTYPTIYAHKVALDEAFCSFMNCKVKGLDGSAYIPSLFNNHKLLSAEIKNLAVTESEKQAVRQALM